MDKISLTHKPDKIAGMLQEHGISPTAQRIGIARVLFARHTHFSAGDVYLAVKQSDLHVSRSTIYNTLGLFARHGLVREVVVDPNKVFYDSNNNPHYHIYNQSTGTLTDIDDESVELTGLPVLPEGTDLTGIDIIIRVKEK